MGAHKLYEAPGAKNVQDFTVLKMIPHPQYDDKTKMNDIGLLQLDRPATINQ